MDMEELMDTATDIQIMTLAQWFSPGFPVGAFHFSHGLEWAVVADSTFNGENLRQWIADLLEMGTAANDALFLAAACNAATEAELAEIDSTARAFAPSSERLKETLEIGRTFGKIAGNLLGRELPQLVYPVAVGHAARLADLPCALTTMMYLQAFVASLVAAGTRLIPIGQTEGQEIIRDLTPLCLETAHRCHSGELSRLSSTAFLADIASMNHETQYSRIFRT